MWRPVLSDRTAKRDILRFANYFGHFCKLRAHDAKVRKPQWDINKPITLLLPTMNCDNWEAFSSSDLIFISVMLQTPCTISYIYLSLWDVPVKPVNQLCHNRLLYPVPKILSRVLRQLSKVVSWLTGVNNLVRHLAVVLESACRLSPLIVVSNRGITL